MGILRDFFPVRGVFCIYFFSAIYAQDVPEPTSPLHNIHNLFRAAYDFNINIFSKDTLKIVTAFTPVYLLSRLADRKIHALFYCFDHHKNIRQFPEWCYHSCNHGLTAEILALAALSFNPWDDHLKVTAQVFAISLPFTWVGKNFLKLFKTEAFLRPCNEHFDWRKKSYGGCPSGHMMEAVYAATLFGLQLGPWWGFPLGALATAFFINFTVGNRHFVSQMVAGAGLGVIYAAAASKVVDSFSAYYNKDISCTMYNDNSSSGFRMSMNF